MVVQTGDLTASGTAAQFSVGQTYFFKRSVFDIPGNHDLWSRSAPRDHAAFTSHYGGHYPRRDSIRTKRGSVHLYGLDSNRSSLLNHRMANGEIPTETIRSVCEEMRRNASPTAVQVVCLHHPLTDGPEPNLSGTMGLQDCEKIATEFSQAGAGVILAGHVHRQRACLHQGMLHLTAASLCQAGEQPSFWLLDFYRSRVKYTHFEVPSGAIHFVPVESKSGEHVLGRSPERR